jgi:hypothetical protein
MDDIKALQDQVTAIQKAAKPKPAAATSGGKS